MEQGRELVHILTDTAPEEVAVGMMLRGAADDKFLESIDCMAFSGLRMSERINYPEARGRVYATNKKQSCRNTLMTAAETGTGVVVEVKNNLMVVIVCDRTERWYKKVYYMRQPCRKRHWGIGKDRVVAEILGVDVNDWTITMMSSLVEVFTGDDVNDDLEKMPDYMSHHDWRDDHTVELSLPKGVMFVRMNEILRPGGKGKHAIVTFN